MEEDGAASLANEESESLALKGLRRKYEQEKQNVSKEDVVVVEEQDDVDDLAKELAKLSKN